MCYHTCARDCTSGHLVRLLSRTRFGPDTLCEFQSGSHERWNSLLFPHGIMSCHVMSRTDAGEESAPLVYHRQAGSGPATRARPSEFYTSACARLS
jgi:hypothetical protein